MLGLQLTPSGPQGVQQHRAGCRGSLSIDVSGLGGDLPSSELDSINQPTQVFTLVSFFSLWLTKQICPVTALLLNTESSLMFYERHFSLGFSQAILHQPKKFLI